MTIILKFNKFWEQYIHFCIYDCVIHITNMFLLRKVLVGSFSIYIIKNKLSLGYI
jgi:hypothetical protein